jgi:hypothetical protein
MKSWKTTTCGVLGLIAAAITLIAVPMLDGVEDTVANWGEFGAALTIAFGLFLARDNSKSSEDVGAK